ncbi:BTB/POZ domain-containing protein 1-like [Homarus americanus]|uniref:BTB/POZ domain-containing protein 1-like n=1 Tax=Homarus americanus TaxID=6706 RepID=UPI001C47AB5D|nr:BTB/POZ domain-containing protein 1-like [Homarus americanus]XP_042212560.1 BTB/POZ domain-containing protein 1-like [Homarus americanus]XP_042212561.1 BTB/POZ domain-containing protein 1-like [Homarus americanus]
MSAQSGASLTPLRPWQDSLRSTGQALGFLLASGTHSDVTLVVGSEGKQFKAHSLILAMRSPVFEDLLLLNPASKRGVLPLKDDSPWAFHWLLSHIYSDKHEIDGIDLALQILSLSDKYMVASAYDTSIKYLQTVVKRNNVLKIYKYLVHLFADNDSLQSLCKRVFKDNGNAVLLSPALLDLTPEAMSHLLKEPLKITSETVIFKALLKWGHAQLKLSGKTSTPLGIRQEISQFLPLIRFLTMTSDEFVQNVLTTDVLSSDESVFVLKHIANPKSSPASSYLNTSLQINTSRESRASPITKEQMRTCLCEGVNKTWHREPIYLFSLIPSDNIVLLAVRVQLEGGTQDVKLEIRKEDPKSTTILASVEGNGTNLAFKNPVHLRESVTYIFTLQVSDPATSLFGNKLCQQVYEAEGGFQISISPGIFIQALVFF